MKRNVLLLSACVALMMSANTMLITAAALVGASLAEDRAWATLPIALMFLGTLSCSFPASMLMKHVGRRAGFCAGLLVGICGAVISATGMIIASFAVFCAGMMLIGVFNGFGQYYRFAAADVASPEFRSRAISYVMAGGVVAALVGPNLARFTRDLVSSVEFAGSFGALALLYGLSLAAVSMTRIPAPSPSERRAVGRPLITIARQPVFLVAVLSAMVAYGVMNLVMTVTPLAMDHHGHLFDDAALVIQWHVLGMFAPSFFTGHLIRRFGVATVMTAGGLSLAACAVVNLLGETVAHFFVALVLLGLGWNFLFVGATDLLTRAYEPSEKAKTQGLNDLLVFSTVGITALSSGYLHHHFGWVAINVAVLPLIATALLAAIWFSSREKSAETG